MLQSRTPARFALALLAATCLTPVAHAAPGDPVGPDFQVNSTTIGQQGSPRIAMDARGNFVVVWMTYEEGMYSSGPVELAGRRYNAAGEPQGDEFRVSTTLNRSIYSSVAMNADGGFIVVGASSDWKDSFARRYNAAGEPQGGEFRVSGPPIALGADGSFVSIRVGSGPGDDYMGVFAQRYGAAGEPQGGEFLVNTTTYSVQTGPQIAIDADGDFVVVWHGMSGDGDGWGVLAQRYNAAGEPLGGEFQVNSSAAGDQLQASVAMDDDGDFVVAWASNGSPKGIFVQRFDAAGTPQGSEVQANTYNAPPGTGGIADMPQVGPSVAMDADGDFVVTWDVWYQDGSANGVFARRFDHAGNPTSGEIRIGATTENYQIRSQAAMDADGDFVVAWNSHDGSNSGVFAQRFQGKGHIDGDFESDGRADILWRNAGTGNNVLWRMSGFERLEAGSIGMAAAPWRVAGVADFDGDYRADVLWRNDDTTATVLWQMDGASLIAAEQIGSVAAAWQVEGLGDFDGDAKADVLWRNVETGTTVLWRMDGFTKVAAESIGAPATSWQVAGAGDFDGDAKADILWRNVETGTTVLWRMDGFTKLAAQSIGAPPTSWQVAGTGDFDGDAKADILWRNTDTGNTVLWRMDGFEKVAARSIGVVNASWTIAQLRDTNGDDRADVLWRNAGTGVTVLWQMDGFARTAGQSIGTVNASWQIE